MSLTFFRSISNLLGLSKSVVYSLAFRALQAGSGVLALPVVVSCLNPEKQGYYYTFISLVALQSMLELGLTLAISVFASHEWVNLELSSSGHIQGDAKALSRLIGLGRVSSKYFAVASIFYFICVGFGGFELLSARTDAHGTWVLPWLLLIGFSALLFAMTPFFSILEGCNQVSQVAKFRCIQTGFNFISLLLGLWLGAGLFALSLASAASLLSGLVFIFFIKRRFFSIFLKRQEVPAMSWSKELLPMQWRLAVQGLFAFATFPLYTLLAYRFVGASEAGRIGMTGQVVSGVQSLALVFISSRGPEFAMLAATAKHNELYFRCKAAVRAALGVMGFGYCLIVGFIYYLGIYAGRFSDRLSPSDIFILFAMGALGGTFVQGAAANIRAYRVELLTPVGVTAGLTYAALAWVLCIYYGSFGLGVSYLLVTVLLALPWSNLVRRNFLAKKGVDISRREYAPKC